MVRVACSRLPIATPILNSSKLKIDRDPTQHMIDHSDTKADDVHRLERSAQSAMASHAA